MTLVRIRPRVNSPVGLEPAEGRITFQPTRRLVIEATPDLLVLPAPFDLPFNGNDVNDIDLQLAASGLDWAWKVTEHFFGAPKSVRYLAVPDVAEIDYTDLIEIDIATLDPVAEPQASWFAYVDGLALASEEAVTEAAAARDAADEALATIVPERNLAETARAAAQGFASAADDSADSAGNSASGAAASAAAALVGKADAETASGAAQTARTGAEAAQTGAQTARDLAVAARSGAETAQTGAQSAKTAAEAARDVAEGFHSVTVTTGAVDGDGHLILTRTDETTTDAGYVVGPPLTVSVLGTATGPETAGVTGAQGPIGLKGDPGGIVLGTSLGTNNLNDILTPGVYRQGSSVPANMNYPSTDLGSMVVYQASANPWTVQEYTPFSTTDNATSRVFYRRIYTGSTWKPWRAYTSSRVDQTAGRALYEWDSLNNREQLVYGDTGARTLDVATALVASDGNATFARIRRDGRAVVLSFRLTLTAANLAGANVLAAALPVGFRPAVNSVTQSVLMESGGVISAVAGQASTAGELRVWYGQSTGTMSASFSYFTNDAWPTTLPGAASGTIPNL